MPLRHEAFWEKARERLLELPRKESSSLGSRCSIRAGITRMPS